MNFLKKISLINLFILICCICLNKISNSVWISEINSENPLNLFCTMSTVKACNKSEQYAEFEFLSTNEMSFNFSFHDWQSNNIILNYDINNFPSLIDIFFNNGLSTKKIKFSNFKFEGKNASKILYLKTICNLENNEYKIELSNNEKLLKLNGDKNKEWDFKISDGIYDLSHIFATITSIILVKFF